jgi:hypothetical protein
MNPKHSQYKRHIEKKVADWDREIDVHINSLYDDSSFNEESIDTPDVSNTRIVDHIETDDDESMLPLLPPYNQ